MVQFGMKTEPNWTELFAKFKITELNWTVCISNWTKPFQTELNCSELNWTVIIDTFEKNMKKTNEIEF